MNKRMCCPTCRALCCVFNESDTCCKYIPSKHPGYDCPDFLCRKDESRKRFYDDYLQLLKRRNSGLPVIVLELAD